MREYWTKAAGVRVVARAFDLVESVQHGGIRVAWHMEYAGHAIQEEGMLKLAKQIKRLVNRVREAENLPGGKVSS